MTLTDCDPETEKSQTEYSWFPNRLSGCQLRKNVKQKIKKNSDCAHRMLEKKEKNTEERKKNVHTGGGDGEFRFKFINCFKF